MKPAVLVASDGSESSLCALPHAAAVARAAAAQVRLVRILDPDSDLPTVRPRQRARAIRDLLSRWTPELQAELDRREIDGEAEVRLLRPTESVAEAITAAAREREALLVAMHTRGAGLPRPGLLGSVSLSVLASTDVPLILTGPQARPPRRDAVPLRLVITTDGSPASDIVLIALSDLLNRIEAEVTIVHVCELRSGRPNPAGEVAATSRQLESLRQLLPARLHATARIPAVAGAEHVSQDILRAACNAGADAIALSTHGRSAEHHRIAGSTALDLLANSPFPLILTRYAG